jgi:transcriptional regulator with XRE-family HTH domain
MRQEDLAKLVSVDQATVSLWESGEIFPGADNLRELSRAFEVPIEAFYGDTVNPDEETSPGYMPRVNVVGEILTSQQSRPAELVVLDETRRETHLLGGSLISSAQRNSRDEIALLRVRGSSDDEFINGDLVIIERTADESMLRSGDVIIVDEGVGGGFRICRYSRCGKTGLFQSIHEPAQNREVFATTAWTKLTKLWGVEIGKIRLFPLERHRKG